MIARALGLLLIIKALSPFLWLLAAYLVVMQIADGFGDVSGAYSRDIQIQLAFYDDLADRIDEQIEAFKPTIERAVGNAIDGWQRLQAEIEFTSNLLENLPEIDLSNVVPEFTLENLVLFPINIDWDIPEFPGVKQLAIAVRNALQALANAVNAAISSIATEIKHAISAAMTPFKEQLYANLMAQFQPYLDAYGSVKFTMDFAKLYYDTLWANIAIVQFEFEGVSEVWERIAEDLEEQIGLSIETVDTVPGNLDRAIDAAANLLLIFGVLTLALFLVFYWATMMRDLLRGWMLMMGRYDEWRNDNAEQKPPLVDRWLDILDQRERRDTPVS